MPQNVSNARLFRTKICGLTSAADVQAVAAAGGDAIGLNFYPPSRRYLANDRLTEVLAALGAPEAAGLQRVGVFVNATPDTILQLADQCQLHWIQLHGDEGPDFSRHLQGLPILRALPYGEGGLAAIARTLQEMADHDCLPDALLLDAADVSQFGGTGRVLPWSRLQSELAGGDLLRSLPWVLAGGLTAENVAEAIRTLSPQAVDVASGVESAPGVKGPDRIGAFVRAAELAWRPHS